DPEHLVLHVCSYGAICVHGELDVITLFGVRLDTRELAPQIVGAGRIEVSSATGWVPADEDRIRRESPPSCRRLAREGHGRVQVALVEAVEVDLEHAANMRFVVRE